MQIGGQRILMSQSLMSWKLHPLTQEVFFHDFIILSSADFFQNQIFRKILSEIASGCQTSWIHIKHGVVSGLIWVQTVCKCYLQTTLVRKW